MRALINLESSFQIQMRMYPPGSDTPYNGTKLVGFMKMDEDIRQKMTKSETSPTNKV